MSRIVIAIPNAEAPYAALALAHARDRGDAPIVATDDVYAWLPVAHLVAAYVDHGVTQEMADLIACARALGLPVEYRTARPETWAAAIYATAFPNRSACEVAAQ